MRSWPCSHVRMIIIGGRRGRGDALLVLQNKDLPFIPATDAKRFACDGLPLLLLFLFPLGIPSCASFLSDLVACITAPGAKSKRNSYKIIPSALCASRAWRDGV